MKRRTPQEIGNRLARSRGAYATINRACYGREIEYLNLGQKPRPFLTVVRQRHRVERAVQVRSVLRTLLDTFGRR